jgi:putative Mg2+ transporter-C (MgtC) family protein
MAWHYFVAHLGTALVLGAVIGAERQWHQRIAGLRTNALVSGGAAMFVSISHLVPLGPTSLQVAAQVVSGIGFLGAGVIMREGLSIRGLNTAATLWCSAAVGSLCGLGFVAEPLIGAAGVVGANVLFRPLARKIDQPNRATDVESHYVLRFVSKRSRSGRRGFP